MKKILCVLLGALLLCACLPLSAAAAEGGCDCGKAPVIHVLGLGNPVYDGDRLVFPPQKDTITEAVKKAIPATPALLAGRLRARHTEQILDVAGTIFAPIAFDKNGEPATNAAARFTYPTDFPHKGGQMISFNYDWRLDPFTVAAQLKDFIGYVKEQTGHDSVYLVGKSLGAAEMNTYLATYGFDGIESLVWYNGAYKGVASCGDSFANRNNFTADALAAYLRQVADNAGNQTLCDLFSALETSGLLQTVFDSVLSATDTLQETGKFSQFLREHIGRIPGFWALVSSDNYEAARAFAFPTPELEAEYAGLLEKLDRYHNEVSVKADEIMRTAQAVTGKVGVVCGYGEYGPPVTADNTRQSDGVILTEAESNGATCAPLGQTLGGGYTQKLADGHDHLSPDGVIDASTAFFPDNTWFVKYGGHSFTGAYDLTSRIFFTEGFDVFSDPDYPQFLRIDPDEGELVPLTADNAGRASLSPGFTAKLFRVLFTVVTVHLKLFKAIVNIGR